VSLDGFGSNDYGYSEMLHKVITRSEHAYVLADCSKVGKVAANFYARLDEVTGWISDDNVPTTLAEALTEKGVQLIVAQ
jgi:DeoR/GlpR family transcriptional regulator of sugar metabolism